MKILSQEVRKPQNLSVNTVIRKDIMKRVGKIMPQYLHYLSSKPRQYMAEKDTLHMRKEKEASV
jgi:hypothetical protein